MSLYLSISISISWMYNTIWIGYHPLSHAANLTSGHLRYYSKNILCDLKRISPIDRNVKTNVWYSTDRKPTTTKTVKFCSVYCLFLYQRLFLQKSWRKSRNPSIGLKRTFIVTGQYPVFVSISQNQSRGTQRQKHRPHA